MIRVIKGPPPTVLVEYLALPPPPPRSYGHFGGKAVARDELWKEQRGLCCYCMRRIEASSAQIEHREPQTGHADNDLNWKNLFAVCDGGSGRRLREQHCDERKKNIKIKVDMLKENLESLIDYTRSGRISARVEDWSRDIDETLNLNCEKLLVARAAALEGFVRRLHARLGRGRWTPRQLDEELRMLEETSSPPSYLGFVRWFLVTRRSQARTA